MSIIDRHIKYCPKCKEELYFYCVSSGKRSYLKCKNCNIYYEKGKIMVESELPVRMDEYLRKVGVVEEEYHGIPTSIAYKPKWLKLLEKIVSKSKK